MHEVFICYDDHDLETADEVLAKFEENNIKCWINHRDADLTNSHESISKALTDSRLIILILSIHSINSKSVFNELYGVFSRGIPIIPFRIDKSKGYGNLSFFIRNNMEIDGHSKREKKFEKLISNSCQILGKPHVESKSSKGLFDRLFGRNKKSPKKDVYSPAYSRRPFKAYSGKKPYIFASYAHKDADLVFPEIKRFHDEGYPIWYDQGLTPGQEWDEEIEEALVGSALLIVFITENSMASSNVVDEIKLALEERIDIIPIYLENAELASGLKLRLSQKHAIFKFQLHDEDYIKACFKAFDSADIPKL